MPTNTLAHLYFSRQNATDFTLADPTQTGNHFTVTAADLQLYIAHDDALRQGIAGTPEPAGYSSFARRFNSPAGCCTIRFARVENGQVLDVGGEAPTTRAARLAQRDAPKPPRKQVRFRENTTREV